MKNIETISIEVDQYLGRNRLYTLCSAGMEQDTTLFLTMLRDRGNVDSTAAGPIL